MSRRGFAIGMQQLGNTLTELGVRGQQQEKIDERQAQGFLDQMIRDVEDKVASGALEPEAGVSILRNHGIPEGAARQALGGVAPSTSKRLEGVLGGVEKAKTFADVPSPTSLATEMKSQRIPLMSFGKIDPTTGKNDSTLSPELQRGLDLRNEKEQRIVQGTTPTTGQTEYNQNIGAMQRGPDQRFNPITQKFDTFGEPTQISPTPQQAGFNKAEETRSQLQNEQATGVPTMRGQAKSAETIAQIPGDVAHTTAVTTAAGQANLPFQKAMAQYANELAQGNMQLTTINDPKTGEDQLMLVNKRGEMIPVQMPEGMAAGRTRQIPATIADNTAGINAAEIESVKILRALRKTGLDRSNDPLDPRFNQFLVNTLRIAPKDLEKGDMQQRIGFVNATMTRALMGSRPSQYVAKEIIQPHLPQQNMTGAQLARVLTDVLQQAGERRNEFAHTLGLPIERLAPQDPNSYANFLKEAGTPTSAPATLTLDPKTGQLVPIRK